MSQEQHKYPRGLSFWTTEEEGAATLALAEESGIPLSSYLRMMLRQHLRAMGVIAQPVRHLQQPQANGAANHAPR